MNNNEMWISPTKDEVIVKKWVGQQSDCNKSNIFNVPI